MSSGTSVIDRENTYEALTYDRYPVVFTHGDGYKLFDTDGKQYIDLYGGHCVSILGHTPERVRQAMHDQAGILFFYSNVAYSPVRADAAERLVKMSPDGFDRVFFCNSGTEANENAIKLAWKMTGKTRLVATTGGWHGRTLASLSITDDPKITDPVSFALVPCERVPFGDAAALEACLQTYGDVAAVILEPIQSIAGMVSAPDQYYRDIREICTTYNVVLIFDEIQTGVGRTGKFSVSEWYGMKPDLITIAEEGLIQHAIDIFETLKKAFAGSGVQVLGRGALIGLKLPLLYKDVKSDLFSKGWLTGGSIKPDVMRLMSPLITPLSVFEQFAHELTSIISEKLP